ncbi:MAG: esterase/lipase family protein [Planctomycetales bacterium]
MSRNPHIVELAPGAVRWRWGLVLWVVVTLTGPGCAWTNSQAVWLSPEPEITGQLHQAADWEQVEQDSAEPPHSSPAALIAQALILEAEGDAGCVDAYYLAAQATWREARLDQPTPACEAEAALLYHACLSKLLVQAQRHQRFDPCRGLLICSGGESQWIPIEYVGFTWEPGDFRHLELVGEYDSAELEHNYRNPGLGVPLVVVRSGCAPERFHSPDQAFAATALLVPGTEAERNSPYDEEAGDDSPGFVLRLIDPLDFSEVPLGSHSAPLAGDLTAPFVWYLAQNPTVAWSSFFRPDDDAEPQLIMMERYQPGKIPVVFVHGILSEPTTWFWLGNELRAAPWFRYRYQIWAFKYPTGRPFLASATDLRQELEAAVTTLPQGQHDPALSQMVLIGHSMGGLVSKLQVADSGTQLWDQVATRPFETLQAPEPERERIRDVFFFAPVPEVRRVIFIGTPHQGSSFASHLAGKVGSRLVSLSARKHAEHRQVIHDNPGLFVRRHHRIPTSVDLLRPHHPLLTTLARLPVGADVRFHSIIGDDRYVPWDGRGDGVVSVESARYPEAETERLVPASHTRLHRHPETLEEVDWILREHLGAGDGGRVVDRRAGGVSPLFLGWLGRDFRDLRFQDLDMQNEK